MTIKNQPLLLAVCLVAYVMMTGDVFAASNQAVDIINKGTGLDGTFDNQLKTIANGFWVIGNVIMIVMTSIAAVMVGMGIEDSKRTFWNWTLGIGLLWGFGNLLSVSGLLSYGDSTGALQTPQWYQPDLKTGEGTAKDLNFLSDFMRSYLDGVITPGAHNIQPYCIKIMLILAIIEVSWNMTFNLISGDKVKYILTMVVKLGIFVWLIMNWIPLMNALGDGFQAIGFQAGGLTTTTGETLKPDSIFTNALAIFDTFWSKASFKSIGLFFVNLISLFIIILAAILTAIEMFMARIEFYTMALITMPLLPFMITSKFSFLGDKAIGAMFNLAIKVAVIAFITSFAVPFMQTFADKVAQTTDGWKQVGIIFQCVLAMLVVFYLTKKIPELVTGLLNGQPSLGGAGMVDTARAAAGTATTVVAGGAGVVRGASAIAQGKGKGGALGTLSELGKAAIMSRSPVQKYRNAMQKMDSLVGAGRQSASNMRTNMGLGRTAGGHQGTDRDTMKALTEKEQNSGGLTQRETEQLHKFQAQFNNINSNKKPSK